MFTLKDVSIVQVEESDIPLLLSISKETCFDTFSPMFKKTTLDNYMTVAFDPENFNKEFHIKDSWFYFIKRNSKEEKNTDENIMGYLKININSAQEEDFGEEAFQVQRLYIRKPFQRKGLGKLGMDFSFDLAKKMGKKLLWLGVYDGNLNAQKFYKKIGMEKDGFHKFVIEDEIQTHYIMKKEI